jgi:uncharacterized membrane protein
MGANMKENRVRKTLFAREKEPSRLLALSDGLFATVLTLLVLDLKIPDALNTSGTNLTTFTRWVGPHLFSYLMTFFVGGVYWLAHHRNFDRIVRYDRGLLGYNLLFLLFIGLFPFSTAAISQAGLTFSAYPYYWAIYSANMILAGIMLNLIWLYAVSHELVNPGTTRQESRSIMMRQIINPAVFLLSIGAEFLFPQSFLGPWFLLTLLPIQVLLDRLFPYSETDRRSHLGVWPRRIWHFGISLMWILIFSLAVWVLSR